MNLKQETWELIVEGLEKEIECLTSQIDNDELIIAKMGKDHDELRSLLLKQNQEIIELKSNLNRYEKQDRIEQFISKMGRRYVEPNHSLSWQRLFYILYPSADEVEYRERGKARKSIIWLLRSGDLGIDDNGTIFKQSERSLRYTNLEG